MRPVGGMRPHLHHLGGVRLTAALHVDDGWLMLQQDKAEDFVIATGVQYSVREFIEAACAKLGLRVEWRGAGTDEEGVVVEVQDKGLDLVDGLVGQAIIRIDPRYFRPTEVESLLGDASKAREKLGWEPRTGFGELVGEMMEQDLDSARRFKMLRDAGYNVSMVHE